MIKSKAYYDSPLGKLILCADDGVLSSLCFDGQKYCIEEGVFSPNAPVFKRVYDWLDRYFEGEKTAGYEIPLNLSGSGFRKDVWNIISLIPYGKVTTYKEIAEKIAAEKGLQRMSAQAVGGAVGHNPVLIIIPCHRVIGSNGALTGYAGGLDRKIRLLGIEGITCNELNIF